jgi:hypothetical protein
MIGLVRLSRTNLLPPPPLEILSMWHVFMGQDGKWLVMDGITPESRVVCVCESRDTAKTIADMRERDEAAKAPMGGFDSRVLRVFVAMHVISGLLAAGANPEANSDAALQLAKTADRLSEALFEALAKREMAR